MGLGTFSKSFYRKIEPFVRDQILREKDIVFVIILNNVVGDSVDPDLFVMIFSKIWQHGIDIIIIGLDYNLFQDHISHQ